MKTVGKQLEEARLAKDWTPELAARETKIKIERLRDLEADDYSHFSSPTYARGFVRTYARSLGLDEYKLLRQLDNKLPEDDNASFANDTGIPYMPEPSQISSPVKLGTGVYVAMGVGGTVLFLIAFVLFQSYRAGYFAQAEPAVVPPPVTNAAPAVADADTTARAMPADSNAAPVALPVDPGSIPAAAVATTSANGGPAPTALPIDTNAAIAANPPAVPAAAPSGTPVITVPATTNGPDVATTADASPASTTPLDTKSPPRALPVDLSAITPADASAPNAAPVVPVAPAAPLPPPRPPPLSAREANNRPVPAAEPVVDVSSTPPVAVPVATAVPTQSTGAEASPSTLVPNVPSDPAPAVSDTVVASTPSVPVAPVADTTTAPLVTNQPPVAEAAPQTSVSSPAGKRLILTASHDSFIRVVSLDDPTGERVRYASVLHSGESISFNDRKYSINVGVPSAVDIDLDGINYGPHSDHSEPDTFTVESRQP